MVEKGLLTIEFPGLRKKLEPLSFFSLSLFFSNIGYKQTFTVKLLSEVHVLVFKNHKFSIRSVFFFL